MFGRTVTAHGDNDDSSRGDEKVGLTDQVFRKMADSLPEAFWLMDPTWSEVLYANNACERIYGVPLEVLKEDVENWTTHIVQDDLDRMYSNLAPENIEDLDQPQKVNFHLDHPEKGRRLINLEISPIPEEGETKQLVGLATDITDHEETLQNQLDEQQNFLESIINAAPQGIFVKTSDGQHLLVNETVGDIFGVPPDEIQGKNAVDLVDDGTAEKFHEDDQKVLNEGGSIQFEDQVFHEELGEVRTFLTVKTLLFEDRPPSEQLILGITTDVTKRKSLQKEVEKQKQYLQRILNSAPNLIFVKDWNGVFRMANEALANFYDATPDDLVGRTDADFNPNMDEVESFHEADRDVMRSGEVKEIPEEPVTNVVSGETHWFQTIKVPLFTDKPVEDRQVLGISTDITEKKQIRENLEASLREKEILLGEIHHRVKNNLQIVQSILRTELREAGDEKTPALQDCINRIHSMALLHEKLYQSEKLSKIDISSYFDEICQYLKKAVGTETENIEISHSADPGGSIPIQEAVSWGLVLNELVTNALHHGFRDGEDGCIDISFQNDGESYELIVEDNGHGLPEGADITDVQSTGVRIIRSIVEYEFNGQIDFQENNGVRVVVTI